MVCGNHDVNAPNLRYAKFLSYDFCDARDPALRYQDGVCWAQPLSAGGTDFLILGLGWRKNADYLDWAREVLSAYPDRIVIVLVHDALTGAGALSDNGQILERELFAAFPSIRHVICGHANGSFRQELTYPDGHSVHIQMFNFQEVQKRGKALGFLRILTFDPLDRSLSVTTYSPWLDQYNFTSENADTFVIKDAF